LNSVVSGRLLYTEALPFKLVRSKPVVLIVGALPPPAIGPSLAMERLVASSELHARFDVTFLDISDRRAPTNVGKFDWMNLLLGLKHCVQCLSRLLFRKPDLVYLGISQGTWGFLRDLSFLLPALVLGRPIVLHLRGSEFREFYDDMPAWLAALTRLALRRARRVIVLGDCLKRVFDGLVEPGRIVAIPNGIGFGPFTRPRGPAARAVSAATSPLRLLYLSSLRRRKGLFVLLEAVAEVFSRHPDVSITIAGDWQDETEKTEAQELISRLNLAQRLRFVGEITGPDKIRLFHEHDVFVFTPVAPEGLPWVILEAMSASLPVITANQGAIVEVVEHGRTGLIVSPAPSEIAKAICDLIQNPDQARRMGDEGRKRVEQHFSEETYLSKLLAVFSEVARNESPASAAPVLAKSSRSAQSVN
jgi:glycosyltransferase involved in cell wall biosynthesis